MSFLGTEFFMQQQNITLRPAVVGVQLCNSQSFLFFHQIVPNIFHKNDLVNDLNKYCNVYGKSSFLLTHCVTADA